MATLEGISALLVNYDPEYFQCPCYKKQGHCPNTCGCGCHKDGPQKEESMPKEYITLEGGDTFIIDNEQSTYAYAVKGIDELFLVWHAYSDIYIDNGYLWLKTPDNHTLGLKLEEVSV